MRLTKEAVPMIEHEILNDSMIWECDTTVEAQKVLYYIEGVRTMAEEVIKAIESLKKKSH